MKQFFLQHSLMWIPYLVLFNIVVAILSCRHTGLYRIMDTHGWFGSPTLNTKCKHMEIYSCGAMLTDCQDGKTYWCVLSVKETH